MASIYNQATLSYAGGSILSNITEAQLLETLSLSKTAVSGSYRPGEQLVYLVNIVNTGDTPVTGLSLSDDLGAISSETQTVYPLRYVSDSALLFSEWLKRFDGQSPDRMRKPYV